MNYTLILCRPKLGLHGYRKIYNLEGVSYCVVMQLSIRGSLLLPAASPIPSPKMRILPSQTIASHLVFTEKINEPILFMGTLASLSWRPFHWENRGCQRAFYFPQKLIIWAHLIAHYIRPSFLLLWIHCPDPSWQMPSVWTQQPMPSPLFRDISFNVSLVFPLYYQFSLLCLSSLALKCLLYLKTMTQQNAFLFVLSPSMQHPSLSVYSRTPWKWYIPCPMLHCSSSLMNDCWSFFESVPQLTPQLSKSSKTSQWMQFILGNLS